MEDIGVNVGEVVRIRCNDLMWNGVKFVVTKIGDHWLKGRLFEGADIYWPEEDYDALEVLVDYPVPEGLLQ